MKVLKKMMTLVLMGVLLLENSPNVYAAESIYESRDYIPNEETNIDISDIVGTKLQNDDKIIIGDYTIEYQENIVCLNPYSKAATTNCTYTSQYKVKNNQTEQVWYKIVQTTNYTYDGTTAKINIQSCNLNVTQYYDDCDYKVNKNAVNNSSSTDPTHTIGLTMKLGSKSLTITDVVTVHADGTNNRTHYEEW